MIDDLRNENEKLRGRGDSKTPILDNFGDDLTQFAKDGKLDPVIGRDKEFEQLCQVLSRRTKNNPVILGEAGSGKTSIVELLAQKIINKEVSNNLLKKRVVSINMTSIVAGTKYRGEFEERMRSLVEELKESPDVIVFVDELHTIVGAGGTGGSLDVANILKPALSRGQIQFIGATTFDEYREHIEKDGALNRRFQPVHLEGTSYKDTLLILKGVKPKYEEYHSVTYTDEVLEECVKLTDRYITHRAQPDKAIDVLDEAGARTNIQKVEFPVELGDLEKEIKKVNDKKINAVENQKYEDAAIFLDEKEKLEEELEKKTKDFEQSLKNKNSVISKADVAKIISDKTGIPISNMTENELERLNKIKDTLNSKVIGQEDAIEKLSRAIRRNRTGVGSANRPQGVFMFLGSTGTGKTHVTKELAKFLFGSEEKLIRVDMNEFGEKFAASRLAGAPPGYVGYEKGGEFTEKVRRNPYSVILLDEVEKAHPDVYNTFLQIFDEGYITDTLGRKIDFRNTIIIMTSNVGSRTLQDFGTGIGFGGDTFEETVQKQRSVIEKELKNKFSPEFLNRVDDVVTFNQLSKDNISKIVEIELSKLVNRMDAQGIKLTFDKKVIDMLVEEGYDAKYGARPMRRAIQQHIEDKISDMLIDGEIQSGGEFSFTFDEQNSSITLNS